MFRRFSILILFLSFLEPAAALANEAALVVDLGNRTITRCVTFDQPVINTIELIQRSGLDFTTATFSFGEAVCSIENTGCQFPEEPCFCQCPNAAGECLFFALFFQRKGEWVSSHVGESHLIVHNGDVIGLAFGPGTPPELITFEQVCGTTP